MPTYEYLCKKCGQSFDVVQSFRDKPLRRHVTCGGDLQKVIHARGILFKGSGFYSTDSRSSPAPKTPASASADKPADTTTTKKSTSETSSKDD
jgi:putative FmdB family regulatory protein